MFETFLNNLLSRGLRPELVDLILKSETNIAIYKSAFTSSAVNADLNYEMYEQMGDVTINKFLVWYFYKRFPQLKCPAGVKVIARLRINYSSKKAFARIADRLGFWEYIVCTQPERERRKNVLLEDVFEAFIGATESIIDNAETIGLGYAAVYSILDSIFSEENIRTDYDHLFDAKTRLKELFDFYGKDAIGTLKTVETKVPTDTPNGLFNLNSIKLYRVFRNNNNINYNEFIGEGVSSLKVDAEQIASAYAITKLNNQGFKKDPPEIFKTLV